MTTTPAESRRFDGRSMLVSLLLTLVVDIGLSILVFEVLTARGVATGIAYLVAGVGPVLGLVVNWARTRTLGGVSIIVLVTLLLSALVTLIGSQDLRVLLLKDAVLTGAFGLVTLASALPVFGKPLMFSYGLKFGTDGSRQGVQEWYDLWDRYATFRHSQYVINNTWGVAYVLEAGTKVAGAYLLPYATAYAVNQILPWVVLAGLIFWTISYGKAQRRAGAQRAAAAAAAAQEAEVAQVNDDSEPTSAPVANA